MSKAIKTSPIFYQGNKYRLINRGLTDLFPNDINIFVDLFCGSGVVSMNVEANYYLLNDRVEYLVDMLRIFKDNESSVIIDKIKSTVDKFKLTRGYNRNDKTVTEEEKQESNNSYLAFREHYNTTRDIFDLYVITYYSFSNLIRFNAKGDFNMPQGNQSFLEEKHSRKIIDGCNFFSQPNVHLYSKDFRKLNISNLTNKDFVYFDPPYTNTTAVYNENRVGFDAWSEKDDYDLFAICEALDKQGVKWGLSNVFRNKGVENTHLIEWCKKNNWNVHYFEGFSYSSLGKGNANSIEVYISNYEPNSN